MNEKNEDKYKQQHKQALRMIQVQVMTLRKRMCSYGVSTEQFIQIMQGMLDKILSKGRPQKLKNVTDLIKAIEEYVYRKKGKTLKLLIQIMANIDCQMSQLQSSSHPSQQSEEIEQPQRSNLKIQGRRLQYGEIMLENEKKKINGSIQNKQKGQEICYVKLEALPDMNSNNLQQLVEADSTSNKRRAKKKIR